MECDYSGVDAVRQPVKQRFREREGYGLTYLPFVARAVIDAVGEYPHVNASLLGEQLHVYGRVNLGIAVDLDFEGLVVPVVRDARDLRVRGLARALTSAAERAHARALGPDDVTGGTFTITNAGGYGTFITGPIINQPQVAILSTDGVRMRPVAVPDPNGDGWSVTVHPVGNLALSFDHRAFDGAYASAFLRRVVDILETRDWSTEL